MANRTERHVIALDQRIYARVKKWKDSLFPNQKFEIEGKQFESRRTTWNEFFLAVLGDVENGYMTCMHHRKHKVKCEYCLADYHANEQIKNVERDLMAKKLGKSMEHKW